MIAKFAFDSQSPMRNNYLSNEVAMIDDERENKTMNQFPGYRNDTEYEGRLTGRVR